MSDWSSDLEQLIAGVSLEESRAASLMAALAADTLPAAQAGAMLAALAAKGETADEIRGFAREMRARAVRPALADREGAVDCVGTGGDGSGSFNLSTGASLLAAACGVPLIKHGNRSVSSKSGSADLLESLGVSLGDTPNAAAALYEATGFTFLFAPVYHPAMKSVVPIRKAMGVRTVFNILGPLTNPAAPPFGVIGAYSEPVAELMAHALSGLEMQRVFVVHGHNGWDEATPVSSFTLFDVRPGEVTRQERTPEEYGVSRCEAGALAGGDAAFNADGLMKVFDGTDSGAHRDALAMGVSLMLEVSGRVDDPKAGVRSAMECIEKGTAQAFVSTLHEAGRG
ncbi:MAG: anthranilate phosphoribosyltransferase [Pseudomonadota bacterium]